MGWRAIIGARGAAMAFWLEVKTDGEWRPVQVFARYTAGRRFRRAVENQVPGTRLRIVRDFLGEFDRALAARRRRRLAKTVTVLLLTLLVGSFVLLSGPISAGLP